MKHQEGDSAVAEKFYKRAIKDNPYHLDARYLLGTLYAEKGDLPNALKCLLFAASINPKSQMVQNNLGNVYLKFGQFEKAAVCFQRALEIQPDMPEVYNNLGNIYKRLKQYDQAESNYRIAIKFRPESVDARYNLAVCLRLAEKYPDAIDVFEELLALFPSHRGAQMELGRCYLESGRREDAISILTNYLGQYPDEENEVALMLAFLDAGGLPGKYPSSLTLKTYREKAEFYDSDAENEAMQFLGPKHVEDTLVELGLERGRQMSVLDLGCGTGACGFFLREYAKDLVGVDLSPQMIRQAEKKGFYTRLECADLMDCFAGEARQLDLVVASGVLILFGNLQPIFGAIKNLMKEGGVFVATVYRSDSEQIKVRHNMHFAHSAAAIEAWARSSGLRVILMKDVVHEYEHGEPQPGYVMALGHAFS
ncbi:MAG: tetratricopeptide repeat protein [Nitrosomonadales bacterium]|nr:tetratricopeptide repeat protein [Nitrosomonadales bacterium]